MPSVQKTVLPNGISVITEEMPGVESCSIGIWVNAGSRNETRSINGVSHFIEHLLFKGTKKRTALDISREIESVGGVLNAFTGREYTCFYAKILNKDLPKAIDLLSDIFMNSKFDSKEMEKEKLVVLQEIKMVEDTPDDLIHDLYAERFWQGDPLGWSILGPSETIKSMNRERVLAYFKEKYAPHSVFITAAGGLKHSKALKLLKPLFGKMKSAPPPVRSLPPASEPGVKLIKKELEQVHMCLGVPMPPQSHPDRYKVYLINTILGSGMSSRLFQEVREKRGLAYSVYTYLNLCKDAGTLVAYAGCNDAKFAEVSGLIMKEFERLGKDVKESELQCAKEQLKGGMLLGLETSENRMMKLARDEMYFGKPVTVREIVRDIDKVTLKDLRKSASELLSPKKLTVVAMGKVTPKKLPAGLKGLA
jgi:predicted Zn-dependent peptidase